MKLQNEEHQLRLWKKGFVLGSACYHFAPPDLRADFDKIRSAKIEEQTIEPLRDGATWPEALGAAAKHLKPCANQMRAEADTSRRLQGYLLRLIGDGHILALGYALPRGPDYLDRLINENEAAAFVGYTTRALQGWRVKGGGPKFVKVSARSIRYRRRDLIAWAEARLRSNTSEDAA